METVTLSKEALLNCAKDYEVEKLFPAPNGDGYIKLKGLRKHSELTKVDKAVDMNKKYQGEDRPDDSTIEAATWLSFCLVEPQITYDEALVICENSGMWTSMMLLECQKLSGITNDLFEKIKSEITSNPFDENISKPA